MSKNRAKYLFKNTAIFAIANIASKIITFFLLPLYTYVLLPEQFGVVDLLFTIATVIIPIISFNIIEAIIRFALDENADNNKIMSIGICMIFSSIILALPVIPVLNSMKNYAEYSFYFYFYIICAAISDILLYNLKGQEKLKLFSLGNVLSTFFIAIFNILFLVVFKCGIKGYFLANISTRIIIAVYSFFVGRIYMVIKNFEIDKKLFKNMIKYSFFLIPNSFMWWIINASDRVMVSAYIGEGANGLYGISYKIPNLLTTFTTIFNQAWVFSAIDEKDSTDKKEFTNKIFENLFFILIFTSLIILIFLKFLFKILFEEKYFDAWLYVPILLVGYVFLTLATFLSSSYNVYKDSRGFLYSSTAGAIINVILNFIFIPKIGVIGAAISTTVSYIGVFLYRLVDTRKYVIVNINLKLLMEVILLISSSVLIYLNDKIFIFGTIINIIVICFLNYKNIKKILNVIIKKIYKKGNIK